MNEKLVRDKIPDIIRENGETPEIRIAGPDGDTEELVDIQEAIDALLELRKADPALIEIIRHSKLLARGGFTKGYVLISDREEE